MVNKRTASKEEIRAYDRKWYANNEEYRKRQTKLKSKRRRRHAKFVWDYKAAKGCQKCPEKDPCCLDFHHVDGVKEGTISNRKTWSLKKLEAEMDKCKVFCANCHRKEHYYENNLHAGMD
jgi:hypothetical protein